ncbi:response regulator [Trinickia diaoshuihuensis]|uniref:response regulator n=1 Tax=Trinickia diaoshuihuensis TaxID=2292265 RepID=UPI000E21DDFA|nr:response regulator [Trinickia diaoshuihuensis]
MRILLVEDDELIGSGVEISLRQAGYAVDWARDGREADLALATNQYALVVLDLGLPGRSGGELLKALRDARNDVPVLVLTARGTIADRVRGLDAGADDYLGKPFDLTELLARCRALVRRSQGRSVETIVWRDLSIDLIARSVMRGDTRVHLTSREWAVLVQLITHQGIPQSRADLEDSLYGWQEEIESNAIEVHMSKLRRKLGQELITTVRGVGYMIEKP